MARLYLDVIVAFDNNARDLVWVSVFANENFLVMIPAEIGIRFSSITEIFFLWDAGLAALPCHS